MTTVPSGFAERVLVVCLSVLVSPSCGRAGTRVVGNVCSRTYSVAACSFFFTRAETMLDGVDAGNNKLFRTQVSYAVRVCVSVCLRLHDYDSEWLRWP